MEHDDFRDELEKELISEFDCGTREAKRVSKAADQMRKSFQSRPGGRDDFDVTTDLVVRKLKDAAENTSVKYKWNWWAGSIKFLDEHNRSFKID